MANDTFAYYEKESVRLGIFGCKDCTSSPFLRETRFEVNKEKGKGWGKMLQVNSGLFVGLSNFHLKERPELSHYRLLAPIQFNILLSGHFDLQLPGKPRQTINPGAVWFGHNQQDQVIYGQHHSDTISAVSIGLPAKFAESWLGNYNDEATRSLERLVTGKSGAGTAKHHHLFPLADGARPSTRLMQTARDLLFTEHQTIFGKLHFESLALELLAQILELNDGQTCNSAAFRNHKAAVEVGTNECYLKKGFRNQTGRSIGQYIRELRMSNALELLASRKYSMLEISYAVGYANPSQFSAAFKRFYGETPSRYLFKVS
nr:MAG: hypothetical protein CSA26_12395 [Desulfobacterales bacterium]